MRRRGYSLVEILIVLAILGILLTMAAIGLQRYINFSRLQQATQELSQQLRNASGFALTRNQDVTFSVLTGGRTVSWTRGALPAVTFTLSNNSTVSVNLAPVNFSSRGLPLNQHVFTVNHRGQTRTVTLLVTSKVVNP